MSKFKKILLPTLTLLAGLLLSASAAYYSVLGLSKLFAGASLAVMIMGGSLEFAKLVVASFIYSYRKSLSFLLKVYLTIAVVVIMFITSVGIYGYLSAAYQETANKIEQTDNKVKLLGTKLANYEEQLSVYTDEKTSIGKDVTDLRQGLSNNVIQYIDKETGQLLTTTSSSTRKSLEKQLDQAINRQTVVNKKTDSLNELIFNMRTEVSEVENKVIVDSEIGPLKYISTLTGRPMDSVINWVLLIIIFVFDPLAVALIIASNFGFAQLREKELPLYSGEQDLEIYKEKKNNTKDYIETQ